MSKKKTKPPTPEPELSTQKTESEDETPPKNPPPKVKKHLYELTRKGHTEVRHDLYKLEVAQMKKNVSWKYLAPRIETLEHCHIFHSHNEKNGLPNKYCTPVGGHFHEVSVVWDGDNIVSLKCGPPLSRKKRMIPGLRGNKIVSSVEAVKYLTHPKSGEPDIVDTHEHEISYRHSETITQASRSARSELERAKVSALMDRTKPATQHLAAQTLEDSANKAKPLVKE